MKRAFLLFCFSFYFPLPLISYQLTMTTVWGTPDPTSVIFDNKSLTWDECVQSCYERTNCAMVHQEQDSEFCKSYSYGDVWRVDKDTADKVSIKVTMDQETCFEDPWTLFNSTVFDSFITTSTFTSFSVVPTDQYYTFSYISTKLNGCKDWLLPETDCNCLDTMVFFYGTMKPNGPLRVAMTTSWKECMFLCWDDPNCFVANMAMGSDICVMIDNGGVSILMRESEETGKKVAVKLSLTSNTCNLDYLEVLNNHRFASPPGFSYPSFQFRTSPIAPFIGVNWIDKDNVIANVEPFEDGSPGGFMVYGNQGITKDEASLFCTSLGDDFMPVKSLDWLKTMSDTAYRSKKAQEQVDNDVAYQYYIGLSKINEIWTWSTPGGITMAADAPDLMWADGYPKSDHDCAWLVVTDPESVNGRTLQSTNCSAGAMGMICHVNLIEEGS